MRQRRAQRNKLTRLVPLLLAAMLFLHLALAWHSRELVRQGYQDFTIFYSAGKIVRMGLGPRLYYGQVQNQIQQQFAGAVDIRSGALPYNHPPFEALLFVPFSWLPYFSAYLLWDLLNLLILAALPVLMRPHVALLQELRLAVWVSSSLAFYPVFIALLQGQDIILLLLLLGLAFVALKRDRDCIAGCWLALGLFRFQLVLPLVLILMWKRPVRTIAGFVLVAFLLAFASVMVVGWNGFVSYPAAVLTLEQKMLQTKTVSPSAMPNLRGVLEEYLPRLISTRFSSILLAGISIALVVFAAATWRVSNREFINLTFALGVIITVLVSYHAMPHDLSLLIIPVVLVVDYIAHNSAIRKQRQLLCLLVPIFVLFFTPLHMLLSLRGQHYNLMALVLVIWAWGIAAEIRRNQVRSNLNMASST